MALLQKLHHPNIVKCFGSIESEEYKVIKLEYIDGTNIGACRSSELDERTLQELVFQIALALEYIQWKDIIHLDLSPSNIVMTKERTFQLIDFGIADVSGVAIPRVCQSTGNSNYAAPELEDCGECAAPCDVWCLGLTLMNLISGRVYRNFREKLEAIGHVDHDASGYSEAFRQSIKWMLNVNPKERITASGIISVLAETLPNSSNTDSSGKVTVKFKSECNADSGC
jgi:serine/threonine protein kinase